MTQRYVDPDDTDDDLVVNRTTPVDPSADLERSGAALPTAEIVSPLDRSLDIELGARLDRIRRPATGAVGFADWTAGEKTLSAARSAYAVGDLAAAGMELERAERSFVRSGSPIDAAAVGLEWAALAALDQNAAALAEIARRAEIRLLTDLPVGLRAALQVLIRAIKTDYATPGLTAALADYGHMVRTGTTAAKRFDLPERPIPQLLEAKPSEGEATPGEADEEGSPR